ncbi:MAG: hypothetical protein KF877_04600 [Bacteroidetes bacterium]|nr:hypothetical protein [Bacteroidota bacterium]
MTKLNPIQINQYLDKLFTFVEGLPMGEKGKEYIKFKFLIDFLDTWQFDDEENDFTFDEYLANPQNPRFIDVKTTYGIQNTTQIKRYMAEFIASLKKARNMKLDKYLVELDKLHPNEKAARLSKSLAALTRAELFAKYGFDKIKEPEWNEQLKEILGSEITFAKEQAELLTKAPKPIQHPELNDDDVLIVEELENRLAIEAVEYKRKIDNLWETHKFDPSYFDTFISGPLLTEFTKALFERIRPLNNQEINKYLSLSLQQFKTHTPPKRHKAFLLNYHNTYWFPNVVEYKENEYDAKYATHVWKHYANHFSQFKEATEKVYNDFKAGLVGNSATGSASQIKDDNFNIFIKSFEYNYPLEHAPLSYFYQWRDNLSYFKKEVLSNLIHLDQSARKPYLNRLKFELNDTLQHCHTSQEDLENLYSKYETSEEQLLRNRSYTNPLHIALNDEPPKFKDTFEEGFNPDTENIQHTFYNFHYGKALKAAIEFLDEQAVEYGINQQVQPVPINKATPTTGIVQSFIYKNFNTEQERITDLLNSLKKQKLVDNDTALTNFRSVFNGKQIERKIIWTGNISELAHFIKTLHNTEKKVHDTKQKQWEITINCFEMADGTELTKDKLRGQKNKNVAKAAIIEKAVKIL